MSYNTWYNTTGTYSFPNRFQYFREIINNADPDILVIVEVANTGDVNTFLTNVMNFYTAGEYSLGNFIANTGGDSPISSNAIYYKSGEFDNVTNTVIHTTKRDINRFRLRHINSSNYFDIYAVHLTSGSLATNADTRKDELSNIFPIIKSWNSDKYILLGDFNMYKTSEPGYLTLTTSSPPAAPYFIDPKNYPVDPNITWANAASVLHSHSTRKTWTDPSPSPTTGLINRFDYIFMSPKIYNGFDSLSYNLDYTVYAMDDQHFGKSISVTPYVISQAIAEDLYYASDHLPVFATFTLTNPVPVELVSFTAQYWKKTVILNWNTATEVMNYGFDVERSVNGSEWNKITFVNGYGSSNVPHDYTYEDTDTDIPGNYRYRLKQIDTDGKFEYSPIAETEVFGPDKYSLSENYPNPFNPSTTIEYQVPVDSKVTLRIMDILGREILTLVDEVVPAGKHKVIFDGSSLSSGIYIYQLSTNDKLLTRKMMLLK